MKDNLDRKEGSILVPFIVGGVLGAGIALLLAPKSGKEIRNDIQDFAARSRNTLTTAIEEGRRVYDEGKSAVTSAVEAGKAAFVQEREHYRKAA